ncbi:hypothetical protein V8F20_012183 [Naviculisporaceae sp. PSN 640]
MAHFYDPWELVFLLDLIVTVIATVFVFTRLATRYFLGPDKLGYDDWILFGAWVIQALRTTFLPLSYLPFFRHYATVEDHLANLSDEQLYMYECFFGVSVGLGAIGEGTCRAAVAAFLYRICNKKWHKRVILCMITPFAVYSLIMACLVFYSFGSPTHKSWEPLWSLTYGYRMIILPARGQFIGAMILDFFFAACPWVILHGVQIRKAKKRLICLSLSLGVIAGGAEIACVYKIMNYSEPGDALILHIYSSVERGITFISISVPAFLPLWIIAGSKRERCRERANLALSRLRARERERSTPPGGGENGHKSRCHGARDQWDEAIDAIDDLEMEPQPANTMSKTPQKKQDDVPQAGILRSQSFRVTATYSTVAECSALKPCEDCAVYYPG